MAEEWYKFAYDAWDEGTHDLSLEEEAAYLRVCNQIYRRKGAMVNSERLLCSLWRCHPNRARKLLESLLAKGKLFVTDDGKLMNTRARQELDARETLGTRRADAGHTGGTRSGEVRKKSNKNNIPSKQLVLHVEAEERRGEESRIPSPNGEGVVVTMEDPKKRLYDRARAVLGEKDYGKMVTQLLKAKNRSLTASLSVIEAAAGATDPKRYVWGAIKGAETAQRTMLDDGDVWRQM